ncbi:hypothetical protein HHL26_00650 [Sphingobium sp. TB-6]|uniref:hypothetical protein n=1 Tax=Sphingobium sp. TB-6 TaxID=2728850 RepID=UPI00146D296C|nr:hypothetical protein [Sphingobium sp. TB-6]NML87579.1 hypothetical protein [Sphingobium sp. TB-6]
MTTLVKLPHGTPAWFEMVGGHMREAAAGAGLPPDLTISVVERYIDGVALADGLVQGLRFDIVSGKPTFRAGVGLDEQADILIEITSSAAHRLNTLYSADPAYHEAIGTYLGSGEMRVQGDPSQLGDWLGTVHDPIVDRTL